MRVSHTMLSNWRRCRLSFFWKYVEGWRSKVRKPAFRRGTAGHAALAAHYGQGLDVDKCVRAAYDSFWSDLKENEGDAEDWLLLERVLRRYLEWALTADADLQSYGAEVHIDVPLAEGHSLQGYWDAPCVRNDDTSWIREHKFSTRAPQLKQLDMDPQVSLYILQSHLRKKPVTGVLFNVVRVSDGPTAQKTPAARAFVTRKTEGLRYVFQETVAQASDIAQFLSDCDVDELDLHQIYRSPMTDRCHWDCDFYGICLALQSGGDPAQLHELLIKDFKRR